LLLQQQLFVDCATFILTERGSEREVLAQKKSNVNFQKSSPTIEFSVVHFFAAYEYAYM
jgi:hypothetical protein